LIVDDSYELPIAYEVNRASRAEAPKMHMLYNKVEEQHKELLERCEYGFGDRGYDDGKLYRRLWGNYEINPVIDIKNNWKDGEEIKQISRNGMLFIITKARYSLYVRKQENKERWRIRDLKKREKHKNIAVLL
jgi:hypothetical protein